MRKKSVKLSDLERQKKIVELRASGKTSEEIAGIIGTTSWTVNNILRNTKTAAKKTLIDVARVELQKDFDRVCEQQKAVLRLFERYCADEKIEPDADGFVRIGADDRDSNKETKGLVKNVKTQTIKREKILTYLLSTLQNIIRTHNDVVEQKIKILIAAEPEKYTPQEVNAIFLKIGGIFRELLPDDRVPEFLNVLKNIKMGGSIPLLIGGEQPAIDVAKNNYQRSVK